jgi:hypothetical protein
MKAKHLASFIAHGGGQALFVGIYEVRRWEEIGEDRFWSIPEHQVLKTFGGGRNENRERVTGSISR